jgi:hypothetical protein
MKLATANGDEILPNATVTALYFTAVRDALDRWQRGEGPRISAQDCARVVRLITKRTSAQGDLIRPMKRQHDGSASETQT